MKKGVEIAFGTIVIILITILVLMSIIVFYSGIYLRGHQTASNITQTIRNRTNITQELIINITNVS